jgi:N-acetylmuramoyl-L-alanine amidase
MPRKIGRYHVRQGNADVPFWPLPPDKLDLVAGIETVAWVAPVTTGSGSNTLVAPPDFGIFDVLIEFTMDQIEETEVTDDSIDDKQTVLLQGKPTINEMDLILLPNRVARATFAVFIKPADTFFEGVLKLWAKPDAAAEVTLELPIKVEKNKRADKLFVFCIVRRGTNLKYCWFQMKTVESNGGAPVVGVTVRAKVLRDQSTYKNINRRCELTSAAGGLVAKGERNIVALPIEWPLIFNTTMDAYVPRGHMLRFHSADVHHNLAPFQATDIQLTKVADVNLAHTRIMLDPGHGCVYGFAPARRSQEWFVAHRTAERVSDILTGTYNIPAANVLWTRTAGFGLIAPNEVHVDSAPENGDGRFVYDMPNRRIRIKTAAGSLKQMSDLLLTTHDAGNADAAQPVADAGRTRLLTLNAATVNAIVTRLNTQVAASHRRVADGSVRWDSTANNYIYTQEKTNAAQGQNAVVNDSVPFPVSTTDWFMIDAAMLDVLASRSAAWSLRREIGSGPAADSDSGRPAFTAGARAAMEAAGARGYMHDKILLYLNVAATHAYLQSGIKAWGPNERIAYINANACDLYLSFHENADGGIGGMTLVSVQAGADAPPADQIRKGKIMLKYLDPFDQGVRQTGLTPELGTNPAALLHHGNHRRVSHVYMEMEFMDAVDPNDASQYTYNLMVQSTFIDTLADQIASAAIEMLFNPQAALDAVKKDSSAALLGLW